MSYGERLAAAMASCDPPMSVRGLARELRPNGIESMRRMLRRFLNGSRTPGKTVAYELVSVLERHGADVSELRPPLELDSTDIRLRRDRV